MNRSKYFPKGFLSKFFGTLLNNKKLLVGFSIFLFFIILALISPFIVNYNPLTIGRSERRLPPSSKHPLGTDIYGRDIFDQIVVGLRYSLYVGILAGSAGTFLGLLFGLLSGYKGGNTDTVFRNIADVLLVIPTWPLLVLISAYVRVFSIPLLAGILAVFSWPWAMRSIRSQVMSLREKEFINLAKITGMGDIEIAFKEILPNMLPYIGVIFGSSVTGAMIAEAGLELIGIGPGNVATLGIVLNYAWVSGAIAKKMYLWLFSPVICLVAIFISLQLINMGLDEIYNPRLKKITGE